MELLVHDFVEQILERLPSKSLLRFKSISKQWKSTIESPFFQHKHFTHHRQKSKNPDLFLINKIKIPTSKSMITSELESSISNNIPIPWENNLSMVCQNSIDGLICFYNEYDSVIIFNPTTRWYRTLPPSNYHQKKESTTYQFNPLGFGKDQINGLYKPVWLYNSNNVTTTCEVFDFKINAWRLVEHSYPKMINDWIDPIYLNGLLYWLTEEEENTSVLSFDLHTETFEIVCKVPFTDMILHNLNNDLYISNLECSEGIWLLNLEEKTWKKMYFIDLLTICPLFDDCWCTITPLVFMEEKKKKFMLCDYYCYHENKEHKVVLYDSQTMSYRVIAKGGFSKAVCYFQSLISIY